MDQSQLLLSALPQCVITFLGRCASGYCVGYSAGRVRCEVWYRLRVEYTVGHTVHGFAVLTHKHYLSFILKVLLIMPKSMCSKVWVALSPGSSNVVSSLC